MLIINVNNMINGFANEKNPLKAQMLLARANILELRIRSIKEKEERNSVSKKFKF